MPINGLKQDGVHFLLCAKQGNNIEGVVLHRVCVLGFCFVLNRVRGLQTLSSSPIVNYWSSTPSPPPGFKIYLQGLQRPKTNCSASSWLSGNIIGFSFRILFLFSTSL